MFDMDLELTYLRKIEWSELKEHSKSVVGIYCN